jgi:hypothetical protein
MRSEVRSVTPYPELNQVLTDLVVSLEGLLGDTLVGVHLQGSFAVGDFDEHSDVDFIVVLGRELTVGELERLDEMHSRIYHSGPEWAKHLEGSYFTQDQLSQPPGVPVPYLDHGSYKLESSSHCNTWIVRAVLHGSAVVLYGPPANHLIPAVDVTDLRREMAQTMGDWGSDILSNPEKYRNRFYQGFIVLSYCRVLRDYEAGAVGSKRAGAEWAKQNLSREWHDLIDRSWTSRPDPATTSRTPPDEEDFSRTLVFLEHCLGVLKEWEAISR